MSAANLHPGSSAPTLKKIQKKILEKFKKFQFFMVVDNLTREVGPKIQLIWASEQLSAKKTKSGSVKMFTVHALFLTRFVFFAESYSDVQISWILGRTSRVKLSTTTKKFGIFWFFLVFFLNFLLSGSRWARAPGWIIGVSLNFWSTRRIYTRWY